MKQRFLVLALAAASLTAALPVHARDCSGYNTHVNISLESTKLADGHVMIVSRASDILVTDDPKHIYNLMMGECSGTLLTTPDGKTSGLGHCLRKDKDGDTASIDWSLPAGSDKGTWKSTGGTGKYADLQSSGWWQPAASDGGKLGVNRWGGTCSK
ncbi:MAG: hypothetical protein IT532_06385 [Burkholderiales bacterium]|nr:hypothetical protein [Burkholderiales bacterium]